MISRFSDSVHHQVEEYALGNAGLEAGAITTIISANTAEEKAMVRERYKITDEQIALIQKAGKTGELKFSKGQIEGIHKGNTQRDYSQVPKAGNAVLLNQYKDFGGYHPEEHFDNFIFDVQNGKWRTRGSGGKFKFADLNHADKTPIDYIRSQVFELATNYDQEGLTDEQKMVYAGNAFHTIEDFFAHSNFVELTQKDSRHGNDLITGSVNGTSDSLLQIGESVSGQEMKGFYHDQAEAVRERSPEGSHSKMSKDHPGAYNFVVARRLAALVVRQLSTDLLIALLATTPEARKQMLENTFMKKVLRYFRPPDFSDPWWQDLEQAAPANIDSELDRIQKRTPETINQSPFSPLRNLEASSYGPMKMPLGIAIPVQTKKSHFWIQLGVGVMAPGASGTDGLPMPRPDSSDQTPGFVGGIQFGGGF
ncbi:MAG: hypothetical protein R3D00_16680 [Bacteroidia bacterium]